MNQGHTRKLQAILAADVVGYSRLMNRDEEGTLARLQTQEREVVDPAITGQGGAVVKRLGDGGHLRSQNQCAVEAALSSAVGRLQGRRRWRWVLSDYGDEWRDGVQRQGTLHHAPRTDRLRP